nr:MAG TPA: hypothetical protein [Caudoviricetes sp.]
MSASPISVTPISRSDPAQTGYLPETPRRPAVLTGCGPLFVWTAI